MRGFYSKNLAAIAIGALIAAPTVTQADTIVENTGTPGFPGTFNFIGYNSSSVAFGQNVPSQFLEFGGRFHPSGSNADATFIANTTVTATQNGVTINVPAGNSIPDPNLFDARIAYNPNLLGSWQLSVAIGHNDDTDYYLASNVTSLVVPDSANLSPTGHYGVVIRDD